MRADERRDTDVGHDAVGHEDVTRQRPPAAVLFDALGADYEKAFGRAPAHLAALEWLIERLPPAARTLDVGSGTGRPTAAALVGAGHSVLGVDVSPVMVELAARQVPEAEFRQGDVRELSFEADSLDGVCVFFSLLQMTRAEQSALTRRLALALRPGGHLVLATVPADVEDFEVVFMGRPVRATSFAEEDVVGMVEAAGLTVLSRHNATFTPDHPGGGPEPHLFLYCRRDEPGR
ncbi:class I SAM-dependent methyltransferase [Streptomyces sp. NPDC008086]|uniref:class I SAM-dependent methyltransferase n=1 Tax=Streptomyces sp. NPDC008086 TaxID=3364807 RepID=UPI0036EC56E8